MLRLLVILPLAAAIAACGSTSPYAASAAGPASAATNALAGTPMATYGHDLNKARSVQTIVNQEAAQQARAIDGPASASSSN